MVRGFTKGGKFRPTGKKRKSNRRKSIGVEIVSVTLEPKIRNKIKNKQVENIKKGKSNPSFSGALNELVNKA